MAAPIESEKKESKDFPVKSKQVMRLSYQNNGISMKLYIISTCLCAINAYQCHHFRIVPFI